MGCLLVVSSFKATILLNNFMSQHCPGAGIRVVFTWYEADRIIMIL